VVRRGHAARADTCLPAGGARQGRRLEARSDGRSRRSARLGRKRAFDPLQAPALDDHPVEEDSRCFEYERGNLRFPRYPFLLRTGEPKGSPVTPSSTPSAFFLRRAVLQLAARKALAQVVQSRSEEHTSELQSRFDLVCRLLLEKK